MRVIFGLMLAVVLIFPGVEFLRWLAVDLTGLYDDMTLTEAFLGMIVVLLSVLLVRGLRATAGREAQPRAGMSGDSIEIRPQRLGGRVPQRRPRRRTQATERRTREAPRRPARRPSRPDPRDRRR